MNSVENYNDRISDAIGLNICNEDDIIYKGKAGMSDDNRNEADTIRTRQGTNRTNACFQWK